MLNPNSTPNLLDESLYLSEESFYSISPFHKFVITNLASLDITFGSVVDVGCGNGSFLNQLKILMPEIKATGIDISEKLIEFARFKNIGNFQVSSLEDFIPCEKFSLVVSIGTLGLFDDPHLYLEKLARLCDDDGTIAIFSTFNVNPFDSLVRYRKYPERTWSGGHNMFSRNTIESISTRMGFEISFYTCQPAKAVEPSDEMRAFTREINGVETFVYPNGLISNFELAVMRRI
jgi:SAM-dependent methyltransferase